ncbi:TonB-dependent siderophore receptor [Bradyrhizobium sp. CCBAU 51753]|uniref:TonB-dependent siderophore receptor n=1 Tax=Bradyrhizobium sp. CCBAU 51753 TaxID=1325100 RepID=UPI00188D5A2A|nr:TonB-dependent siderophore receptor [Bradyrhizobium sp. CCBAU 51753]QOZ26283.1 TonB-dependent siderophore receptor [Bradyrhizobium sp. CCBAU 51753]
MSCRWMGPKRFAVSATVTLCVISADEVFAQSQLPPVTVEAPSRQSARPAQSSQRAARAGSASRRAATPRQTQTQTAAQPPAASPGGRGARETATGPVNGYLARVSASGTKTSTPIIQTPQSITVIGAEQIRDQKIVSKFDEVLRYTPGVIGGTYGSDFRNDWFLIRGFPAQNESLFLDGLQLFYTSYASWKLQPFNLERVEVLRGPSGILYGGSAPGGLVNAVSKLPQAEPVRYIEAGVNNFGNAYTAFDIGGAVPQPGNAQLLYRFVGQVQGGGTQTDYTYDNNFFFAPSVTWRPDADTKLTVYATAAHNNTRAENFLPYVGTVTNAPFGRIPTSLFIGDPSADQFRREQETLGYQFEKNITDNLDFRQNARFGHVDVYYTGLYGLGWATTPAAGDIARGNFYARGVANQFNLDNQLEYRFNTGPLQHTALFGVDLKHYAIDDRQGFGMGTNLNVFNPVYGVNAPFSGALYQNAYLTQGMAAVYLQDQVKLDRLTVVLSGRQDFVDLVNQNRIGADQSREDRKFSGRVGAIYNFDFGVAPYVSYMTGYNPIIGLNAAGQLQLPETSEQTEVGIKYEPIGLNARFSVAYFDLKRKNALTTDPNNPLFQVQNGEVTSRGIELEAVANITRDFKLVASYTNYDLFVSQDLNPALIGTVPTNTPREFASVWTDYTFSEGPLRGFGLGGGVRYVGSSFADQANTALVPSFVLGDLALHYEWDNHWRAALNVVNVTDKIYVASCAVISSCYYGDRRRITASLAYKW